MSYLLVVCACGSTFSWKSKFCESLYKPPHFEMHGTHFFGIGYLKSRVLSVSFENLDDYKCLTIKWCIRLFYRFTIGASSNSSAIFAILVNDSIKIVRGGSIMMRSSIRFEPFRQQCWRSELEFTFKIFCKTCFMVVFVMDCRIVAWGQTISLVLVRN